MNKHRKIALITGASRGLGKNMALRLAEKGIDIIITYHTNQSEAEKVVTEITALGRKAIAIPLDVTQPKSFEKTLEQLFLRLKTEWNASGLDILVNNAGIGADTLIRSTDEDTLDLLYTVHVKAPYLFTQKALAYLNDNGRVINLSSGLTRFTTLGRSAYAIMKGAIDTFTKYAAKELGEKGITVNAIAPGIVETDFTKATFTNDKALSFIRSNTALKRTATPDDIGGVVAFLCSEDAGWITGQRIEVSGGMFL